MDPDIIRMLEMVAANIATIVAVWQNRQKIDACSRKKNRRPAELSQGRQVRDRSRFVAEHFFSIRRALFSANLSFYVAGGILVP